MKESKATFSDEDRQFIIPLNKLFPAHLTVCDMKEYGNRYVYNPTFRISEEAADIKNIPAFRYEINDNGERYKKPVMIKTNDGKEVQKLLDGKYLVGREFKYQKKGGKFSGFSVLNENLGKSERWKNQDYVDIAESLGIKFVKNAEGNRILGILEDEDLLGLPCFIRLGAVSVKRRAKDEDGDWVETDEIMHLTKVVEIAPWEKGKRMSLERLADLYPVDPLDEDEDDIPF